MFIFLENLLFAKAIINDKIILPKFKYTKP